jgi:hypothetical protein
MNAIELRTAAPLSALTARELTNRIKDAVESLWSLLLEAHERKAWLALGYETWQAYVETEFNMARSRSYQLLDQGRVVRALRGAAVSTSVDITEAEARDIKPVLPQVVEQVRTKIETGTPPVEAVKEAVEEAREFKRTDTPVIPITRKEEITPAPRTARTDTRALTEFIKAALSASTATDEQIAALNANDLMLGGLVTARDLADRIIRRHSKSGPKPA